MSACETAPIAAAGTRRARWTAAALAALAVALAAVPGAHAARPLQLGFFDRAYTSADPAERDLWLDRSVDEHAGIVRIDIGWPVPDTAARPPGFDARDPADEHYDFGTADAAIVAARQRGLQVLASFTGAPRWAEGPGRPAGARSGTWKPSPKALEDYGAALARRYSGTYPDPARPGFALPKVKALQVWNEPNLSRFLTPQWQGRRAASPAHYRRMVAAFDRGVRSVPRRPLVVTAGTAPFGDPKPGGERIMPVRFWRELLCLRERFGRLRAIRCPTRARFDVLAHHPYSVGRPSRPALNDDDVSIPDVGKLTRLLRMAERTRRVLPYKRHRMWVTETSYDSSPPDPDGVPNALHARWVQETLYRLWRQGIDTITWFQVGDQAPDPSYAATNQSGVFYRDGRAKPAARTFRFPFVVERSNARRWRVWGRSPQAGRVSIQRRVRGRWHTLRSVTVRRDGTFFLGVPRRGSRERLRARVGSDSSRTWSTG